MNHMSDINNEDFPHILTYKDFKDILRFAEKRLTELKYKDLRKGRRPKKMMRAK